ncbi:MAG: hypothetical protein AAGD00_03855 [Planctomycetota bacterium]
MTDAPLNTICAACGYDRAGLDDDTPCPECGADQSRVRRWLMRRLRISAAFAAPGFLSVVSVPIFLVFIGSASVPLIGAALVCAWIALLIASFVVPRSGKSAQILLLAPIPIVGLLLPLVLLFLVITFLGLVNQAPIFGVLLLALGSTTLGVLELVHAWAETHALASRGRDERVWIRLTRFIRQPAKIFTFVTVVPPVVISLGSAELAPVLLAPLIGLSACALVSLGLGIVAACSILRPQPAAR